MKENKYHIDKIFREKLQGYSENPKDDLWSGIASGLNTDQGISSSVWYKNILLRAVLVIVAAGVLIYWSSWEEVYSQQSPDVESNSVSTVNLNRTLGQPHLTDLMTSDEKMDVDILGNGTDDFRKPDILKPHTKAFSVVFSQAQGDTLQLLEPVFKRPLAVPDKLMIKNPDFLALTSFNELLKTNNSFKEPLEIKINLQKDSIKTTRWKWFLTGGTLLSFGPDKAGGADGAGINLLFGGGLYLSKRSMLSLTQTENFGSLGYTYLIGKSKLKLGVEGTVSKLGARHYNLGFAIGLGAYYELAPKHRLFFKFSRYLEYREVNPIELTAVSVGLQFNLSRHKNVDKSIDIEPGEYYVQKSPERQNLNRAGNWFLTGSLDLQIDEVKGYRVASVGLGKYLNAKSSLQLAGKFALDGEIDTRIGSRFTLHVNYNRLFGSKSLLLLTQAGVLMDINGGDFLSEVGVYTNLGLGALLRLNSSLDLYVLPNLNRPFFTKDYRSRFAVQTGINFRL